MAGRKRKSRAAAIEEALMGLGCPFVGQLRLEFDDEPMPRQDPAVVLLAAIACEDLEPRVLRALPWLALEFWDLDWAWAIKEARRRGKQNRLGFVVSMAEQLGARTYGNEERLAVLAATEERLFEYRVETEDTLCQSGMAEASKRWLRENRGREARLWNILTDLEEAALP
jgi:hypothetical protein